MNFDSLIPVKSADQSTLKIQTLELLFYYVKTTELSEACTGEQMFAWREFSKTTKTEYRKSPICSASLSAPFSLISKPSPDFQQYTILLKDSRGEGMTGKGYSYTGAAVCCIFTAFLQQRLKDEHEFHLLSFILQQKRRECLEMGSLAYLR